MFCFDWWVTLLCDGGASDTVGHMPRTVGLSDYRTLSDTVGLSDVWKTVRDRPHTISHCRKGCRTLSDCRTVGLSDCRTVGVMSDAIGTYCRTDGPGLNDSPTSYLQRAGFGSQNQGVIGDVGHEPRVGKYGEGHLTRRSTGYRIGSRHYGESPLCKY